MDAMSVVSVALLLASVLLLGNAAVTALRVPWSYSIPLGLGVLAIVLTSCLITADGPLEVARLVVGALSVASLYYVRALVTNRRALMETAALVTTTYLIILLPAIIGGPQFYVFRGNWWDHFNYIAGLQSISSYHASAIRHLSDQLASVDPVAVYAVAPVGTRPAVVLLAATFKMPGADIFAYAYSYLALLLSLLAPVIAFALAPLSGQSRYRKLTYWLALSIPIGFWGQLLLDSSAWSHVASLPLLAMLFYSGAIEAPEAFPRERPMRTTAATLIFLLGAFVMYPEATSIVAVLLILSRMIAMRSLRWGFEYGVLFASAILLAGLIDFAGSVQFFLAQAKSGAVQSQGSSSWFLYTFQPYFGYNFTDLFRDNIDQLKTITQQGGPVALVKTVVRANPAWAFLPLNFVAIVVGYYPLINTLANWSIILSALVGTLIMGAIVVIIVRLNGSSPSDPYVRAFKSFLLPFLALLLCFFLLGKLWEAGKALTFIMPLLLPLFFVLILRIRGDDSRVARLGAAMALLFVASSLYFAAARAWLARDPAGIGHRSPFPSVIRADDKRLFRYVLPDGMKSCRGVVVTEAHANRAVYLLIAARQYSPTWFDRPFSYYGYGVKTYAPPARDATCAIQFSPVQSR